MYGDSASAIKNSYTVWPIPLMTTFCDSSISLDLLFGIAFGHFWSGRFLGFSRELSYYLWEQGKEFYSISATVKHLPWGQIQK